MSGTQRHQDGTSIRSRAAGVRLRILVPRARVRRAGERVMRRLAGRAAVLAVVPVLILGLAAGTAAAASAGGQVSNSTCPSITDGVDDPSGITAGPNGSGGTALWFTNQDGPPGTEGSITEMTTSGACTNYPSSNYASGDIDDPTGITAWNGALWFTNFGNGVGTTIGEITTSGQVSTISGTGISGPEGITVGPNGNGGTALWFTNTSDFGSIGEIELSATGQPEVYNYGNPSTSACTDDPTSITAAPDGEQALWFTNFGDNTIGEIEPSTTSTGAPTATCSNPYALPTEDSYSIAQPFGITAAPDGANELWYTAQAGGQDGKGGIGEISPAGKFGAFVNNASIISPEGITTGPDGANELWFANNGSTTGTTIGQLEIGTTSATGPPVYAYPAYPGSTTDGPVGITTGPDGNGGTALWFTNQDGPTLTSSGVPGPGSIGEITVTPQTITFTTTPPSPAVYGGSYTPKATGGGSGNSVQFSIDPASTAGACSISSSGVVSFTGLGTCVIDANQAGGNYYTAAPQVQQSFTIGQAPQTITFTSTPPTSPAFGSTYTVSATGGASGNPVTFGINSEGLGPCVISGSTVTFIGAGSCIITANQAGNTDYQAAPTAQQAITVPQETPVLTWPQPGTITLGTALTSTELDATANAPGTFTYSPPAGTVLSLGTHTLTATFTPANTTNYSSGTVSTSITVVAVSCPTCHK